jgi:hypothetical protein
MAGRSLIKVLTATASGQFDPERDRVIMGRERHDLGREGDAGYPVRCLRTRTYLYVRNFKPDLWPAGNPETGFTNCDSSPTKDLILALQEQGDDRYFDLCFGKRPAEELYDVVADPQCMGNLAEDPTRAELKESLWGELERQLKETGDPRILGGGQVFDSYEYVGGARHSWANYVAGRWEKQRF